MLKPTEILLFSKNQTFIQRLKDTFSSEQLLFTFVDAFRYARPYDLLKMSSWDFLIADARSIEIKPEEFINRKKEVEPSKCTILYTDTADKNSIINYIKKGYSYVIFESELERFPKIIQELEEDAREKERKLKEMEEMKTFYKQFEEESKEQFKKIKDTSRQLRKEIEERNKIESDLQVSEMRFSKLFQMSPAAISISNADDNKIIDANPSYTKIVGYSRDELIGRTAYDLNIWKDFKQREKMIQKLNENGSLQHEEISATGKDGKEINFMVFVDKFQLNGREVHSFMGLDVTEMKKKDMKLKKSLEKEKELNLLKAQFVSMITHEFRSPLTSISLSADMLSKYEESLTKEEKEKQYERIKGSVRKMTQLMENIFLINKIDSRKFTPNPQIIDLKPIIWSIINNIRINRESTHDFEIYISKEAERHNLDELLFTLALYQVVDNAIIYSRENPHIRVEADYSEGLLECTVTDEGIGINKEELRCVFDTFYKCSNNIITEGFGLGLSIAQKCVETHNGRIEITSELNKGTSVKLLIPPYELSDKSSK